MRPKAFIQNTGVVVASFPGGLLLYRRGRWEVQMGSGKGADGRSLLTMLLDDLAGLEPTSLPRTPTADLRALTWWVLFSSTAAFSGPPITIKLRMSSP